MNRGADIDRTVYIEEERAAWYALDGGFHPCARCRRGPATIHSRHALGSCCDNECAADIASVRQTGVLRTVLGINLGMFGVELVAGLLAGSIALLSDSADMLGDAWVYGLSRMRSVGGRSGRSVPRPRRRSSWPLSDSSCWRSSWCA